MHRVPCVALTAISLGVSSTTSVQAQAIRGQVIDSLTGVAIGNGFVAILDESGSEVGRTLTSGTGGFVFDEIPPGRYRLRSERIGYRARETDAIEIRSGATLDYTLHVTSIPVRLAAVDVRGERRCGSLEEAPGFGDLWEEARKALRAASWSADHQQYSYRLHVYRRVLDTRRRRIFRETVRVEEGVKRVPYVSWAVDSLLRHGYVVQHSGSVTYYGPDANVLLDPSFQATHCFRAVRGEGEHSGMLGLAFEPVPDRRQADIRGTLWVDETSSELRGIDYSYTRLRYNTHPTRLLSSCAIIRLPSS